MTGPEDDILEVIYGYMAQLRGSDILNDVTGEALKEISKQIRMNHDKYLEIVAPEWKRITAFKTAKGTKISKSRLDSIKEIINTMPGSLYLEVLTEHKHNMLKLISSFAKYTNMISAYTKAINRLYDELAGRCDHYYRGTGSDEIDSMKNREEWAKHYKSGYCCLTSVTAAALDRSHFDQHRKSGAIDTVIRYSKDPASNYESPKYGLSDNVENDIKKPSQLPSMHQMEIRLKDEVNPRELDMEVIFLTNDQQERNMLENKCKELGLDTVIFASPDISAREILQL